MNTDILGWLRGGLLMGRVDIRLRFWLEYSLWEAEIEVTDICAV